MKGSLERSVGYYHGLKKAQDLIESTCQSLLRIEGPAVQKRVIGWLCTTLVNRIREECLAELAKRAS